MPAHSEVMYQYKLPCGHTFYSTTRGMPDAGGITWFPCGQCSDTHGIDEHAIADIEQVPRRVNGRRYSDLEVGIRADNMIKRERVVATLRVWCDQVPYKDIAEWCFVSEIYVRKIAKAIAQM